MAIARISGNILQDNLQRGSNLSVQGNLLYIDVTNDRIGVGTSSPDAEFTVVGSANISANVDAGNAIVSGIVSATGNVTGGNLTTASDVTTATVTASGNVSGGNIVSSADVTTVSVTASGNVDAEIFRSTNTTLAAPNPGSYDSERLTLYNFDNPAKVNYAIGVESSAIWHSVDTNLEGQGFKWYGNTTQVARISGIGNLTLAGNIVANANITGANFDTAGVVDATGNVSGGNLISAGSIETANIILSGSTVTSDANLNIATSSNGNLDFDVDGSGVVSFNTTTSLTIPVGNTAQRPGSPETGAIRFNTNNQQVEVYDGGNWEVVGSDFASVTSQEITGDGSTVTFTLNESTTAAAIIVSTNGVVQLPGTAYTVSGNQITFAEAPISSDTIDVRFTSAVTTVTSITNTSGNSSIIVLDNGVADISTVQSLQLPAYTATEANALSNVANGQLIYVSNGDSGNPCIAVYSAGAWKISSLGGNITA